MTPSNPRKNIPEANTTRWRLWPILISRPMIASVLFSMLIGIIIVITDWSNAGSAIDTREKILYAWFFVVLPIGIGLQFNVIDQISTLSSTISAKFVALEHIINARSSLERLGHISRESGGTIGGALDAALFHYSSRVDPIPAGPGIRIGDHHLALSVYYKLWSRFVDEQITNDGGDPIKIYAIHSLSRIRWVGQSLQGVLNEQLRFRAAGGEITRIVIGIADKPRDRDIRFIEKMSEFGVDTYYYCPSQPRDQNDDHDDDWDGYLGDLGYDYLWSPDLDISARWYPNSMHDISHAEYYNSVSPDIITSWNILLHGAMTTNDNYYRQALAIDDANKRVGSIIPQDVSTQNHALSTGGGSRHLPRRRL